MVDFLWSVGKIIFVAFILFTCLNKYLIKCLLSESLKKWMILYISFAFLLPVISRLTNQSSNFAYFLSFFYLVLLFGFSANYKEDNDIYELIESLQKRTLKYAVGFTAIGFIFFMQTGVVGNRL